MDARDFSCHRKLIDETAEKFAVERVIGFLAHAVERVALVGGFENGTVARVVNHTGHRLA